MKPHKKHLSFIFFVVISLAASISYADREQDFQKIVTWAEGKYSTFFSPASASIQTQQPWLFTFYSETNTYIGLNENDEIWVLGDVFGGLSQVSNLGNLLNVIANESAGNGNCVEVPVVTVGSRIVSRNTSNPNDGSPDYTIIDETYTEYTNTHFTSEQTVTPEGGTTPSVESTITFHFTIIDNFIYINSLESSGISGGEPFTVTTEYSPIWLSRPLSTFCEGQIFTSAPTQLISTLNGNTHTIELESSETTIISVNEQIQTPAGSFTTVMATWFNSNTINKQWVDIATGHVIRVEEYDTDNFILGDENGVYLKWVQEATLIQ